MSQGDVFVVGAARSPIGGFGGSLKDLPLAKLATHAVSAALQRSGVALDSVGQLLMGTVVPGEPRDAYLSRVAALESGLPKEVTAFNVNRLCGSGLQAIIGATQSLMLGDTEVAVGAGAESMSRGAYVLPSARWGARMGDVQALDFVVGALHDPFQTIHMGMTAENVAAQCSISREQQDALALESQRRAAQAITEGRFKSQIAPVEIAGRKGVVVFDTDEHPRADTTAEGLAKMRPAFKKDGSVTAGNASGINDGAAAVVLARESAVKAQGLKPMARVVAYGHGGVEPSTMGLGPVPATRMALARAGLKVSDLDVIESNEAFAAQALAVAQALDFDPAKLNPNGSGISLGHPIGATGAILVTKLVYELQRVGGRYGLATMCIGGGQGIALIVERV